MDPIGNRPPTSPYGVIRGAQRAIDAGVLRLIDGAAPAPGAGGPPAAPVAVAPTAGSTVHVVA